MKTNLILLLSLICNSLVAQISANKQQTISGFIAAKEFSKDIALFNAKKFAVDEIVGPSKDIIRFEIYAVVASNSGELTSLVYRCKEKNKEGLILAFYNDSWNYFGVIYSGYGFKDLPKEKADELLLKIQSAIDNNHDYMKDDQDNNNICFEYDDMIFIIYTSANSNKIRVFWNGFHAEWNGYELIRTQKRLNKKLKK